MALTCALSRLACSLRRYRRRRRFGSLHTDPGSRSLTPASALLTSRLRCEVLRRCRPFGYFGQANAIARDAQLLGRRELEQRALQRFLVERDARRVALGSPDRGRLDRASLNLIRGDDGRGHRPDADNQHPASLIHVQEVLLFPDSLLPCGRILFETGFPSGTTLCQMQPRCAA